MHFKRSEFLFRFFFHFTFKVRKKLLNLYHIFCIKMESKLYRVEHVRVVKTIEQVRFHFLHLSFFLVMLKNIFRIFGRRYLLDNGINRQKTIQVKKSSKLMFCLQHVVYAGMNTHIKENI